MSKSDIYGSDPHPGADKVVKAALSDLKESKSNEINGKITDQFSEMPEKGED